MGTCGEWPQGNEWMGFPELWRAERDRLAQHLASAEAPRVAFLKQDVCEDLYCCPSDTPPRELVQSTMLRTGPVALFTACGAAFHLVETVDDDECGVWRERALDLHWDTLEFFSSYRDRIPGLDYGQRRFAVSVEDVDWGQYDIVISVDIAVPQRITRRFADTAWCYFVREIKAPSYRRGLERPAAGYDLFLNHCFRLERPVRQPQHVVEFPYHLQYPGCFHELFGGDLDRPRQGVFVDHHTMVMLSGDERGLLEDFGPVSSPIHTGTREIIPTSERLPRRTMDQDLRVRLMSAKYFLMTQGRRRVHGTALVEAIAAGSLAIGSPDWLGTHGFFFSPATTADTVHGAYARIEELESDESLYRVEVERQRELVSWLCFTRPLRDLIAAADRVIARTEVRPGLAGRKMAKGASRWA